MPIDVERVIRAAVEAALEPAPAPAKPKKRRLSAGRAVLIGAGLMTAGRALAGSRGRQLLDSVQQWVAEDEDQEDEASPPPRRPRARERARA